MNDQPSGEQFEHPQIEEGKYSEFSVNVPFSEKWTYANVFAFSVSPMDIRISFAEVLPDGKAEAKLGIVVAPDQAAYLAVALFKQINDFEQRFGKIRNPVWRKLMSQGLRIDPGSISEPSE